MNGFIDIVSGFSQEAIDDLVAKADDMYTDGVDWFETTSTLDNLASTVSGVSQATKITVSDGSKSTTTTLSGNGFPVWIIAENQNSAVFTNEVSINGDDITFEGFMFGAGGWIDGSGDDTVITKNTFDTTGTQYTIRTSNNFRTEVSYNTFKNLASGISVAMLFMSSYADDVDPAAHHIHHNYFVDCEPNVCMQPRLRMDHTDDVGLGENDTVDTEWNFGRDEDKDDETIIEHNYFLRATKPLNGKMNGIIFRNNTSRDCPDRSNFRAGKGCTSNDNYFFNSNGFDVDDKNHTVYNNYHLGSDGLGAIQISNGGYNGSLTNYREAAENVNCYNNYLDTMDRGMYFGLKIYNAGDGEPVLDDEYPSGDVINNFGKNVTTFIHVNPATSPMGNMTTTPNDTDTATSWDMSGAYDDTDVQNGTVGAGI